VFDLGYYFDLFVEGSVISKYASPRTFRKKLWCQLIKRAKEYIHALCMILPQPISSKILAYVKEQTLPPSIKNAILIHNMRNLLYNLGLKTPR